MLCGSTSLPRRINQPRCPRSCLHRRRPRKQDALKFANTHNDRRIGAYHPDPAKSNAITTRFGEHAFRSLEDLPSAPDLQAVEFLTSVRSASHLRRSCRPQSRKAWRLPCLRRTREQKSDSPRRTQGSPANQFDTQTTHEDFKPHKRIGAISMRHEARLLSGLPREHQRQTEESGTEQQ